MMAARKRAAVADTDLLDDHDVAARLERGELVPLRSSPLPPDPVRLAELRARVSAHRRARRDPRKT
jgi:hypothetical protein